MAVTPAAATVVVVVFANPTVAATVVVVAVADPTALLFFRVALHH